MSRITRFAGMSKGRAHVVAKADVPHSLPRMGTPLTKRSAWLDQARQLQVRLLDSFWIVNKTATDS